MDCSVDDSAAFFQGVFHQVDGLIEVSVKSPTGRWGVHHFTYEQLIDAIRTGQFAEWSRRGREIYYGCVALTERPDKPGRRGNAKLRGDTGILWLDVDCEAPGREGSEYFASIAEAVAVVDACLGKELAEACVVIGSGWGVQYVLPLAKPVSGHDASRHVRALVGWVGETSVKQIDRVWDVTRVMRMPGTVNWRAGPDPDMAMVTGVLRWPSRAAGARLSLDDVTALLGDHVSDVLDVPRLDPELDAAELIDALLARYAHGGGEATGDAPSMGGAAWSEWAAGVQVPGDLERVAEQVLSWPEVLQPHGWRCIAGGLDDPGAHEQIWERPGKDSPDRWSGERSAVVYSDKPELLVVYSDSPACGFSAGLRGGGARGDSAGIGCVSKWRAWVDLDWGGDAAAAAAAVTGVSTTGGAETTEGRLRRAWTDETEWLREWAEVLHHQAMDRWAGEMPPPWRGPT